VAVTLLFAAHVSAQGAVDGAWSPWSSCSPACFDPASSTVPTATRTCTQPAPANGGAQCPSTDATSKVCTVVSGDIEDCRNCTVSYLGGYSACTKMCGTGTTYRTRYITQYPTPGGTPCPQLNFTYDCNTEMCMETLAGQGFYFWGPFKGPGPLSYVVRRIDEAVDAFLFDQDNFVQYQYDTNRLKPFQTNYSPIKATLDIETVKSEGPLPLDANTNYYLVVDHTLIGAAQGTNVNGVQTFLENRFEWQITGLDPGVGYNSVPVISSATHTAGAKVAAGVACATAAAAILL